jgi:hypothetical protein
VGLELRINPTAIEPRIHDPTNSTLFCDGIRVIARWLSAGKQLSSRSVHSFSDRTRTAKQRLMVILNTPKNNTL